MKPIKNILFDFGDVFLNLDKSATQQHLQNFGISEFDHETIAVNKKYEKGLVSTEAFIQFYTQKFQSLTKENFTKAWNSILKDFPQHRLDFLKSLKSQNQYRLFLLSNTNALHIEWVKNNVLFYKDFKSCFEGFYLSHEIHLRKPDASVFEFILKQQHLKTDETLFIDDTKSHIETANCLNLQTWHLSPKTDDVTQLFEQKHLNL
ncbi:HAD family phosphatase [Flavobacterium sp. CS20]|jgi:putative hydrolase of the HAD superfamily|uniref:HAD family hydrolase n=1 Tax=Flavobacterium sp. CS20 TaxID=2775246 RepID=UPI001B3A755D|nr:HAD family phosphatase [Flavobacterium sp. CS20]QTY26170.1 HAD family phosphatase [Flavobacterium sp. CS20]